MSTTAYKMEPVDDMCHARSSGEHLGPGEGELLEVSAAGDTVWERHLQFEPIELTRPVVEAAIDDWNSDTDEPRPMNNRTRSDICYVVRRRLVPAS